MAGEPVGKDFVAGLFDRTTALTQTLSPEERAFTFAAFLEISSVGIGTDGVTKIQN